MKRLALLLLFLTPVVWAGPTRYVTDDLQVVVRTGPSLQHRIIKMLNSGTPVEQVSANGNWSQVRTRDGAEGWVETQYLASSPGAKERLESATATIARLQKEVQELKQSLTQQGQELGAAKTQVAQLSTGTERMKQQLAEASRGLTLAEENKSLRKQMGDMQKEAEMLRNDVSRLQDRSGRDWFVTGALVVFGGFIMGILVTRIRWKRKSSWSSL